MMLQRAAPSASAGEESGLKGTRLLASGAALIALTRFLFSVLALLDIFEMRVVGARYMALSGWMGYFPEDTERTRKRVHQKILDYQTPPLGTGGCFLLRNGDGKARLVELAL